MRGNKKSRVDALPPSTGMLIGRRGVLVGGTGVIGTALMVGISAAPASASPTLPRITASVSWARPVRTFSSDFTTMFTTNVGTVVGLSSAAEVAAGSQCEVSYDTRAFEVSTAIVMTPQRVREVATVASHTGNQGTIAFPLDQRFGGDAADVAVLIPLVPRDLYPAENIGSTEAPVFRLITPEGASVTTELADPPEETAAQPWGIELSGAWTDIPVREGTTMMSYRVPVLVRVRSVGPTPVPAGTSLFLSLDGAVVSECTVSAVMLDGAPLDPAGFPFVSSTEGRERRATTVLPEIAAGSVLSVTLDVGGREGSRLEGIVFARASVEGAAGPDRPERVTGRGMLIDVTSSGAVDSVGAATGTV